LDMAKGFVTAVDGSTIKLDVQTLCVHGDTLGAVNLVKTIRKVLGANDIKVLPMGEGI
ncbi:MAG: LamB/YcsF family protein, partial [Desulfobacteraceae bacterium]|nr:LamB/YcsF family protein [Desulfobacteraceae bacterium]